MSDSWINLIPEDPLMVPSPACQEAALHRFHEIAPEADEIEICISEKPTFHDCGGNFEKISCPQCNTEIPIEWWQVMMDQDHVDGGFELMKYEVPCCGAAYTLHDLQYHWTQGMARFSIEAINPNIGEMKQSYIQEFEEILNTRIRVIYRHL
jgi:hypothetical protein